MSGSSSPGASRRGRSQPCKVHWFWSVLVAGSLTTLPLWAAPLTQVEPVEGERGKLIRIQAQGPLPFEVLEKTDSTLVLFLPRARMGTAPAAISFEPLAEISIEENPVGVRVRFEKLESPFIVRPGKKPGTVEVSFPRPPAPTTTAPTTPELQSVPGTGLGTRSVPGGRHRDQAQYPKTWRLSESAEEDPDPPRPGVAPKPRRRPTPP